MPELPRDRPHLYVSGRGRAEPYTSKLRGRGRPLPQRDRTAHADAVRVSLAAALAAAEAQQALRDPDIAAGTPGFYLDFEIAPGSESAAEQLENRPKHIELVAVHEQTENEPPRATVFIPETARDHFLRKVEQYRDENTRGGKPKNQDLIARIERATLSALRSIYTDDPASFPAAGEAIWWEIWLRQAKAEEFDVAARHLVILVQPQNLVFPDREVRLAFGNELAIGRLFLNTDAIAEIRRARDTPSQFMQWSNTEQAGQAAALAGRLELPGERNLAICVLDTGVTPAHPLIAPALDPNDVHVYDPAWPTGDARGHGTNMAGSALYGDLAALLNGNGPVRLTHVLESVKILPDQGQNDPRLYGAITGESIARAEVEAPDRRRAVCMAVTSDIGTSGGRPSSWSAAVDQLCFGDDTIRRLVFISAGNIRDGITRESYPDRNTVEPIENPAQAWNAITVGAYTEKIAITDPTFAGWEAIAPAGELCPTSRTSVSWQRMWPAKPDVVLEGGNWAASGDEVDCPDDLGLLTTFRDPTLRHFDIFRDTSAATALAGNLAGRIMAAMPERWPETIRALIVHSAEWTQPMKERFNAANSEQRKLALLRTYGYGVPTYERAVLSAANDLTLIAEDEFQPFQWEDSRAKTRHMNLHQFPWPRAELESIADTEVELRVTLSYYVEPNPGERGWLRRHRYPSHALRFAVKRSLETVDDFRRRINAAVTAEEEDLATIDTGADNWYLGRIRDPGSIHSDYWRGTAAELAQRSAIGVYPIGGWWKENPAHKRYDRTVRYALIVSIRAVNGTVDIYTPVMTQIATLVELAT